MLSIEIILNERLRMKRISSGSSCDELFINESEVFILLFFFDTNWSLKDLFSFIKFNYAEDKTSIFYLNMLFDIYILFFIYSIS